MIRNQKFLSIPLFIFIGCHWGNTNLEAQNRSVIFEPLPFEKILHKSREMKREVFLDCYTNWCSPCKRMAREVFTIDSIADYFNSRFVNAKYDLEKEEQELIRKYNISGYPTFLILDSDGKVLKRISGYHTPDEWMKMIRGQEPACSLTDLENRYLAGERTLDFIGNYLKALHQVNRFQKAEKIFTELRLYNTPQDIHDRTRWNLFCKYQRSLDAADSQFLIEQVNLFRDIIGGNEVDTKLDMLYTLKATDFAYWEHRYPQQAFDMQLLDSIINQIYRLDFDKSANSLALLIMEKKIRENQLEEAVGFLKAIQEVRLMNTTYYLQYFSIYSDRIIAQHPTKDVLSSLLAECERQLTQFPQNPMLRQKKTQLSQLLKNKNRENNG